MRGSLRRIELLRTTGSPGALPTFVSGINRRNGGANPRCGIIPEKRAMLPVILAHGRRPRCVRVVTGAATILGHSEGSHPGSRDR